jgi:hypothetical protein
MARRMFAVVDVVKLLRHWQAGDNVSRMARALGLDRKTVRKYVGRAAAAGLVPGGAAFSQAEWASRVRAWFPELTDPRARSFGARRDRPLPRLRREAPADDHAGHHPPAPARRAWPRGERRQPAPLRARRVRRGDRRRARHGAARRSPAGAGGAARLRPPGQLASTPRAAPGAASGASS